MSLASLPDVLPYLLDFFAEYGLVAMFILLVLDGAMLIPILPGEAVMIMAVTQYANDLGDLTLLVVVATAAAILGALILYAIARFGGRPLIEAHPRLFMMDRRRRETLESTFQKPFGQTLVALLRVIPLTRIVVSIPAGLARMGTVRYIVLSGLGMLAFHTGFMYVAFQSQQSGSVVAEQTTALQEAYATPAWQYLQTNEAVAILGALAIGAWLSFKSSRRMLKYPRGTVFSLLGWMTVRVLVLGSLALAGATYYDPQLVYEVAIAGGLDILEIADQVGMEPVRLLAYFALAAWSLGVILWGLEAGARRRQARIEEEEQGPDAAELEDELSTGEVSFDDVSG